MPPLIVLTSWGSCLCGVHFEPWLLSSVWWCVTSEARLWAWHLLLSLRPLPVGKVCHSLRKPKKYMESPHEEEQRPPAKSRHQYAIWGVSNLENGPSSPRQIFK